MPRPSRQATSDVYEHEATRKRLLLAAGEVFADHGFERATVREISRRARANIAAIKYHFGGKFPLYQAAFRYWFDESHDQFAGPVSPVTTGDSRTRLRHFVGMFMNRLLSPGKPAWHAKLMAREMVEPTGVLEHIADVAMKPMLHQLDALVREILGPRVPRVVVDRAVLSIVSQCVFYHHSRPVLQILYPQHVERPDIDAIAEHITNFSYAALTGLRVRKGKS